jgi:Protein kinase domain
MAASGPTDETTLGGGSSAETRRATTPSGTPSPAHSGWLSSSQPGDGRFATGTILADRYRIIGLLGRGGMGEVYRADDLRLGQPVALKFLPQSVAGDNVRLAQFHNEVRVARQVSHRNVCRVYDIGEADGSIFLTMEYVDGEDLASLLKRIGRFPQDRAIEIARQLCAGLAAAHEQGVLHRDLKPANVMLDREGRVRITDFGLAGLASEIEDIRAGTPAYMAPEQLAGRGVSIRSDLFALGLVLFEIFTGKRAFNAKNLAELLRMHDEGLSVTPTSAVSELDPVVERVILRCLEREPSRRPVSAIAVSAALPGGDPLAAALAAGETPSPEMVANAGRRDAISPLYGLIAIAIIVVGIIAITAASYRTLIVHRTPFERPPAVLADRAQTYLASFGYRETPADTASGFHYDGDYARWVERTRRGDDRWRELEAGRAPAAMFWYRTSPARIVPHDTSKRPHPWDPPVTVPGMTLMRLDTAGRLLLFEAIPPRHETGAPTGPSASSDTRVPEPDWSPFFAAAGLPLDRFTPAAPEWTPWAYADRRAAWTGVIADAGNLPIRVEAASHRGRVTSFQILYPWTDWQPANERPRTFAERVADIVGDSVYFVLFLIALVMARRNFRLKRVDWQGAFWSAAVMFTLAMVQWALEAKQIGDTTIWQDRFFTAVAISMLQAGRLWIFYLALEPTVRRFWPDGLISWSRLVSGDWRDPLVGWHILAGVVCGVIVNGTLVLFRMSPMFLGEGQVAPAWYTLEFIANGGVFAGALVRAAPNGLSTALIIVFMYAFGRQLLHRDIYASTAAVVLLSAVISREFVSEGNVLLQLALLPMLSTLIVIMLRAFGMLASACCFTVHQLLDFTPLTFDFSTWYAWTVLWTFAIIAVLTLYGYLISRAGQPLFGRTLLGEHADA